MLNNKKGETTMKYTNAQCEKDFTIIRKLNQFTDQETFMESVNRLISNADSETAERLTTLYPVRLEELERNAYLFEKNKEFSDCIIPFIYKIFYEVFQDASLNKYYILYGEKISKNTGKRYITYTIKRASSRELALMKVLLHEKSKINEDATKIISLSRIANREWIMYSRLREIKEGTVDLKAVADKYFMETGIRLLDNVSRLVMKNRYNSQYSIFSSNIFEDTFLVGTANNLRLSVFQCRKTDRKTMITLLLYYIGFTPEQIEHQMSFEPF